VIDLIVNYHLGVTNRRTTLLVSTLDVSSAVAAGKAFN